MKASFFCIPKKVQTEEEKQLKQIEEQIKQLKKDMKQLISQNNTQFPSSAFFMGAPVAIPDFNLNPDQFINSKEIMSLERKIDSLKEAKQQIISNINTVSPSNI